MDLFFWRSQGNIAEPPASAPRDKHAVGTVYRIAGIWHTDEDGVRRPDYQAKFRLECELGEFRQHDKIACDDALLEVLSKKFILIPISEKP